MCKVYTGYHGTNEIEHGLCACTVNNPLAKARGLSLLQAHKPWSISHLNDHVFGNKLFIRFAVSVFRERLSICVCAFFHLGFEGGMWDLIVLVSDYCLSFILSSGQS